jgi:predicted ATP-dependent endonuclease of OLD family
MKISNLQIWNYRSCIKTRLKVNPGLTTLIGINGAGKTNILHAIRLLKNIKSSRFGARGAARDIADLTHSKIHFDALADEASKVSIEVDAYYDTGDSNDETIQFATLKARPRGSREWIEIDVEIFRYLDYLGSLEKTADVNEFLAARYNIKSMDQDLVITLAKYLNGISYYSATQFSDPSKCPVSLEFEESRIASAFGRFGDSDKHSKFMQDLYSAYKASSNSYLRFINSVNKNGIGLVSNITFLEHQIPSSSIRVKMGGKVEKIEKNRSIVVPSIEIGNLILSPSQLSEGTFKTLALIFYIMNDSSDLLLVEEPEVCVHHGLLSSIIELVKVQSKTKQIIISTHSDYVLDKLTPEDVVMVTKEKRRGTIARPLSQSLSKNDFKALKAYLDKSGNLGEYWREGGFDA